MTPVEPVEAPALPTQAHDEKNIAVGTAPRLPTSFASVADSGRIAVGAAFRAPERRTAD